MVAEGLLEVHPGIGTVVAGQAEASATDTTQLLNRELEQVVVEAKKLGLELDEVRLRWSSTGGGWTGGKG